MQPKVSVILSSFNYARYLPGTIQAILSQSFSDLELIVVDDCSTDESREVLERFRHVDRRIKIILHTANAGAAAARNSAFAASSGEFIAFCDADDVWRADKLEVQLKRFRDTGADVAHSDTFIIDGDGNPTGQRFSSLMHRNGQITSGNLFDELCRRNFICISTVVMRRQALAFAGGFEPTPPADPADTNPGQRFGDFDPLADWVCWAVVSRKFSFAYNDQLLASYRVHGGNMSHNPKRMASSRVSAINFLLKSLPNLSPQAKSDMLYSLGMSNLELGRPELAAKQFLKTVQLTPGKLRSWVRCCQAIATQAVRPQRCP